MHDNPSSAEQGDGADEVVRGIDADGVVGGDGHADALAVFEPAQLLEALGLL